MPTQPDLASVRALEERAFNAWPALQTVVADGWLLRFADGYTKRANSVNAWAPTVTAEQIALTAAPLYAARDLPLIFRLSPLAGEAADAALATLGYRVLDETIVMTAPIADASSLDPAVSIARRPAPAWAEGFAQANRIRPEQRQTHDLMLDSIRLPAAFASFTRDGSPIAWGLAVAERGMVGLFDIVTAPDARRQGAGRRLVEGLMAWGRSAGASHAYLQVVATNEPAIALYRRLGFAEAYRYRYRVR